MIPQGTGVGEYVGTESNQYSNGDWHYIRVSRVGNVATLENDTGALLATVKFGR